MFISTNSVALVAELEVIEQWLNKTTSISEITEIESHLSQSKSFLKILNILYQNSNTSLPTTSAQITLALSSSSLFKNGTLASLSCIIKTFPSSDISEIWIDIQNSQRGSKSRTLINYLFNFGQHITTVQETAIHPGISQCCNCQFWEHLTYACCAQSTKC